jgi:PAS domain S-box-containing protein
MAGLSTPLHLAASLLVLAAATGLAAAVLLGSPPLRGRVRSVDVWSRACTALGALGIAVSSGLAGALVNNSGEAVAWLRAAGLMLIALGLSPRWLRRLTGLGAMVPLVTLPTAAFVAAAAGVVGAVRAYAGGRRTMLIGLTLACWGSASLVQQVAPTGGALLDMTGAVLLGGWLWQVSGRLLLAKLVTAFVAALLVVVVLLASVLSRVGTSQLVADELDRLAGFSHQLSMEIMADWPGDAIRSARAVSPAVARFLQLRNDDRIQLQSLYQLSFASQDFFLTLDKTGRPINWYAPSDDTVTASFLLAVSGSELIDRILAQTPSAGGLVTIGGTIVALGGVRLLPENPRPEDRPLGVLVTGRIVDEQWATKEAVARDIGLVVEVGDRISVASPALPVAQLVPPGGTLPGAVRVGSQTFYRAAAQVLDQDSGQAVGRLYAIGTTDAVAALEEAQARRLFLLALFGALVAACMGWISSRRLVAPIRSLTEAAMAVREGDLSARARIFTRDEVGELGRTFNEMTTSLSAQSAQLREAATVQARLRARLEALTASMSDALIAVDSDGKIVTFNPAAERLVGRDVAEVSGLPLGEVLIGRGPGDVDAAEALGTPDGQEVIAAQVLLFSPQGRWIPTSVTAAPVRDASGRVLGRVFVLRDVSRETELERMKSEFLANVSHELRTPLTPIRGYAEVLARRDVGRESTRKFAEQILSSAGRLERIVGMIVDFAALDSGRLVPQKEPVDVAGVIDEALAAWRARDDERDFRCQMPATLPPVAVDRAMLVRCLDELLDNAVKFSPGGEPVTITAALEPTEPAQVRLSVRDRGVGIEPETAVRVFSDFYQVDATETRHFGGLGLGLALVRRILDSLDGDARVESQVGEGSTFHLLLPVAHGPAPTAPTGAPSSAGEREPAGARVPLSEVHVRSRRGA